MHWIHNHIRSNILKIMFYNTDFKCSIQQRQTPPGRAVTTGFSCMMVAQAAPVVVLPWASALSFTIPLSLSTSVSSYVCFAAPGSHFRLPEPLNAVQSDASTGNIFTCLIQTYYIKTTAREDEDGQAESTKYNYYQVHNKVGYNTALTGSVSWMDIGMMDAPCLEFESCLWPLHSLIIISFMCANRYMDRRDRFSNYSHDIVYDNKIDQNFNSNSSHVTCQPNYHKISAFTVIGSAVQWLITAL